LPFPPAAGTGADGFCDTTGADGTTGEVVEVEDVELVVELVPVVVGWVEVVVGGAAGAHDSVIDTTGSFTGTEIDDRGVPAGTDNVSTCPPNSVTVTAHESAEAVGNAARPERPSAEAAPAAATTSFRVLNTVVYLLPAVRLSMSSVPRPQGGDDRTLLVDTGVCNDELLLSGLLRPKRSAARDRAHGSELGSLPIGPRVGEL
jgi:hypothetical protein